METDVPHGMTLLDFVRYKQNLKAVKIGCREGDCGACTMLIGTSDGSEIRYKSVTSCITPIANLNGKHVVSLEGLNMDELSPVQNAMVENSGTQCGFCTPGFVVSLTGYCISSKPVDIENAIESIDGNICRCTGYKAIERAAVQVVNSLTKKNLTNSLQWAIDEKYIPEYFSGIKMRLDAIPEIELTGVMVVGGGTDLYVQKHDHMEEQQTMSPASSKQKEKIVQINQGVCTISASAVVSDLLDSEEFNLIFKDLKKHLKLVSSTPIRNIGTVAGNFVNASPIGDLTVFFLALNTSLVLLNKKSKERIVPLNEFYKGYKLLDINPDEIAVRLFFLVPTPGKKFNFEKVCKRQFLDIASVNTACNISLDNSHCIEQVTISAGGVGPIPMVLNNFCAALIGKKLEASLIKVGLVRLQDDINPISDVRGSAEYKSFLLEQLIKAHFITLFPDLIKAEEMV